MEHEEVISPQEENIDVQIADQVVEEMQQDGQEIAQEVVEREEKQVPLSALQKERKKRQELEMHNEWLQQQYSRYQAPQQPQKEDEDLSRYESATKEDLGKTQGEIMRAVEEKIWAKQNPEKFEKLNEQLPQFLKQRPHLAHAINASGNRYEEAYLLMDALTPREQKQLKTAAVPRKDAPGSPTAIPKAAGISQTIDVMNMSDDEFRTWRQSKKRAR